jgi:hypothetical protein
VRSAVILVGCASCFERNPQTWIGGGGSTGGGTGMGCGGSRSGGGRVGSCGGGGGVPGGRGGLGVWRRSPPFPGVRALAKKISIRSSGHKVRHWSDNVDALPVFLPAVFMGVFLGRGNGGITPWLLTNLHKTCLGIFVTSE